MTATILILDANGTEAARYAVANMKVVQAFMSREVWQEGRNAPPLCEDHGSTLTITARVVRAQPKGKE